MHRSVWTGFVGSGLLAASLACAASAEAGCPCRPGAYEYYAPNYYYPGYHTHPGGYPTYAGYHSPFPFGIGYGLAYYVYPAPPPPVPVPGTNTGVPPGSRFDPNFPPANNGNSQDPYHPYNDGFNGHGGGDGGRPSGNGGNGTPMPTPNEPGGATPTVTPRN